MLFDPSFLFQVILYQGGQIFGGAPQFYGRVGFAVTMPTTSASIFINNTQLSDTGTYQCLVNNLPDRGVRNIGVIGLTVLGVFIGIVGERGGTGMRGSSVYDSMIAEQYGSVCIRAHGPRVVRDGLPCGYCGSL